MSTLTQLPLFPEKVCTMCGLPKPLDEYYVKVKATGRLFSWCKDCHIQRTDAYRRSDPARTAAYSRDWYEKHREQALASDASYREANREAINERARERRATPEGWARVLASRLKNLDKKLAYNARYRE